MPVGCENQVLATMCHSKRVIVLQLIATRSLAVTKWPCDCCVGQFWPSVTGRRHFAEIIGLSSTTVMLSACTLFTFQILDTLYFEPPLGGLEATYTVHLKVIGKLVVDFLFVLIELFSLGVMALALWVNIDWKSVFFERGWSVAAKFWCSRECALWSIFARIDRSVNAVQLCRWQYSYKKTF